MGLKVLERVKADLETISQSRRCPASRDARW